MASQAGAPAGQAASGAAPSSTDTNGSSSRRRGGAAASMAGSTGAGPGTPVASVTYSASTALMHSALPGHLFTTLAPHLPLHNLHWRPDPPLNYSSFGPSSVGVGAAAVASSSGTSGSAATAGANAVTAGTTSAAGTNPIRTIQSLPLSFEPFSVAQARAQQIQQRQYNPTAPQNATSQLLDPAYPFVHLFLVVCPDSDTYRTTVRNEIRSWLLGIGAFTEALKVSAGSLAEDGNGGETQGAGATSSSTSKTDKHSSLPASGEPEFLIVLITAPEGMPDLSEDPVGAARSGTPPVGNAQDGSAGASTSGSAPPLPPKPGKPARSSTGSTLSTSGTGFFSSMTASKSKGVSAVLEKMRADFNANKRERVVHVSRLPPLPSRPVAAPGSAPAEDDTPVTPLTASAQLDPTIFMDLLTRLKECSSNSLSTVLKTRMASIRALLHKIEVLEPGPASPYWRGRPNVTTGAGGEEEDEGARLFAHYIQSQAFVLRCLEGLGLWEDALEGWNSVADTYMRLVLGGHDPFAPSGATILSAAISQIALPMPHPALLRIGSAPAISSSTPHLVDPTDLLPTLPSTATAALEFRIALYTRRATIQGAYLGKVLHVLQEGANEVRAIGRSLVRQQEHRRASKGRPESSDDVDTGHPDLEAEVWTYQAALQLSRTCDSWISEPGDSEPGSANASSSSLHLGNASSSGHGKAIQPSHTSPAFHAARAETLEVARRQMDRMGICVGWLPAREPWLTGFGSHPSLLTANKQPSDDPNLKDDVVVPDAVRALFSSREIFDLRYTSLTERVLAACMLASSSTSASGSSLSAVPSSLTAGSSGGGGLGGTAGRRRHVLFLRIVCASIDLLRHRWKEAYTALGPLADSCAPTVSGPVPIASPSGMLRVGGSAGSGWPAMEAELRAQCLRCHAALDMHRDRAWVGAVVAWLRATIGSRMASPLSVLQPSIPAPEGRNQDNTDQDSALLERVDEATVFTALRSASAALEKEVAVSGFSPFEVLPAERTATRQPMEASEQATDTETLDTDGHLLKVRVRSALATDVQVDDVRLCLKSDEREQLWFTSGKLTLRAGGKQQVLQLYCASYAPGTYTVDVAQVRIAKVIFQIPLLPHSAAPTSGADVNTSYAPGRLLTSPGARSVPAPVSLHTGVRSGMPFFVHIPEDAEAMQASVGLPEVIRLGERRCGIIEIKTGRNQVASAEIALLLLHDAAGGGSTTMAGLMEAELVASKDHGDTSASHQPELILPSSASAQAEGTTAPGKIRLKNLAAYTTTRLQFPLLEAASTGTARLMLSIDYYSTTQLDAETKASPSPPRRQFRRVQDLFVALPLGVNAQDFFRLDYMLCKFTITSAGGSQLQVKPPSLEPVQRAGAEAGSDSGADRDQLVVHAPSREGADGPDDDDDQGISVAPKHPASFVFRLAPKDAKVHSQRRNPTVFELTLSYRSRLVSDAASAILHDVEPSAAERWQTIVIPVEVPAMDLVNEVDFQFDPTQAGSSSKPPSLLGGQPVRAHFTITSSQRWRTQRVQKDENHDGGDEDASSRSGSDAAVTLLYEIVSDLDTWLICGSTRGTLRVHGGTNQGSKPVSPPRLEITLIPLREGMLPLPQLALKPLEPEGTTCETYMINASARVMVSLARRQVDTALSEPALAASNRALRVA